MAGSIGAKRFNVVLALIVCFVGASNLNTNKCVSAAADDSHHSMIHTARHISPFVRRSLDSQYRARSAFGQSGVSSDSQAYPRATINSGRLSRLASSANCSSNPTTCKSTSTFGKNSTCCAASGTCVNLQMDVNNCGYCAYKCAPALGCCGGTCTSLSIDNFNCGACGTICKNSLCTGGLCGYGG